MWPCTMSRKRCFIRRITSAISKGSTYCRYRFYSRRKPRNPYRDWPNTMPEPSFSPTVTPFRRIIRRPYSSTCAASYWPRNRNGLPALTACSFFRRKSEGIDEVEMRPLIRGVVLLLPHNVQQSRADVFLDN